MEKLELEEAVLERLTIKEISNRFDCSETNVRYWLKKYELKTARGPSGSLPKDLVNKRRCSDCGETDPGKFYGHKKRTCSICQNRYNLEKGQEKKAFARAMLGDSCSSCGFDQYPCSLDIHHLDPEQKDLAFASMRGWTLERISNEMKKCILLCSNCHRAVHNGLLKI